MATISKNDQTANLSTCSAGITANYPATQAWVLDGKSYQRSDVLSLLQVAIAATQTTKTNHDLWAASVQAEKGVMTGLAPVLAALKKALESQWGPSSTKMAEFGFVPAKPVVKTAASKAASAAKARATRAAKKAALASVKAAPAPAGSAGTGAVGGTTAAAPASPLAAPAPKTA
jgi:hypothetical protein